MKRIICICLVLCCVLCACDNVKRVTLTDKGFFDSETGINYVLCSASMSLRPLKTEQVFARGADGTFYTIQWEDPQKYLCDFDVASAAFVYRAEDAEDITLESFQPIAGLVYAEDVYVETFYCEAKYLPDDKKDLAGRDDSALIYSMRDALLGGDRVSVPVSDMVDEDTYYIRLLSQKYPGLCYVIVFFGDVNGNFYLRDRSTDTTVVAPNDVKLRMVG